MGVNMDDRKGPFRPKVLGLALISIFYALLLPFVSAEAMNPPPVQVSEKATPGGIKKEPLRITFIHHAGFLIFCGGKKILIDAHGLRAPQKVRDLMAQAAPPFDGVDLILTTNDNPDHCDPFLIASHLSFVPEAEFISSNRVVNDVWTLMPFTGKKPVRLKAVEPKKGERTRMSLDGIDLEILSLTHEVSDTNLGFIIRLCGWTLFHPGNFSAITNLEAYNLSGQDIDIAFFPFPFLIDKEYRTEEGLNLLVEAVQADRIIPAHYGESQNLKSLGKKLSAEYPASILFRKCLDSRLIYPENGQPEAGRKAVEGDRPDGKP